VENDFMKNTVKNIAKRLLPRRIKQELLQITSAVKALKPFTRRNCNICGFTGYFKVFGKPLRTDACCPNCGSLERHRLFMLALQNENLRLKSDDEMCVLHFAPEEILEKKFRNRWKRYETADLFTNADLKLDIERIDLPESYCDLIIVNHVLEHVDDYKASCELSRVLKDDGVLLCMVPIVEGWDHTYENSTIKSPNERWLHFGQGDHVRFYGRDFRKRIEAGGFKLFKEVTSEGDLVLKHGLLRGEKLFCFQKMKPVIE